MWIISSRVERFGVPARDCAVHAVYVGVCVFSITLMTKKTVGPPYNTTRNNIVLYVYKRIANDRFFNRYSRRSSRPD
jgi:hypothetical protein